MAAQSNTRLGRFIHANGIDIHVTEAGAGEPLILLENGMISTNPIWARWMSSYIGHIETLARHFRVIVPDFRSTLSISTGRSSAAMAMAGMSQPSSGSASPRRCGRS